MFARVFALLPLALLVSASHLEARSQCNTGAAQCCQTQSVQQSQQTLIANNVLAAATQAGGLVGTNCSPVTGIGASSGCTAQQQPVCCTGNSFNGLVNIGCSPINVNT